MNLEELVYRHLRSRGYWWPIPEMSYEWRADFIAFKKPGGIVEVEIKRTWADYQNDKRKSDGRTRRWSLFDRIKDQREKGNISVTNNISAFNSGKRIPPVPKYDWLHGNYPCSWRPNYFIYAAPMDLAKRIADDPEKPKAFGVWAGVNEDQYYGMRSLVPVKRLIRMRPEWMDAYKRAAFERAMWFMDNHFKFEDGG